MENDPQKMQWPKKDASATETSHVALISALLFLIVAVAMIAGYIYYGMNQTPVEVPEAEEITASTTQTNAVPEGTPATDTEPIIYTETEKAEILSTIEISQESPAVAETGSESSEVVEKSPEAPSTNKKRDALKSLQSTEEISPADME